MQMQMYTDISVQALLVHTSVKCNTCQVQRGLEACHDKGQPLPILPALSVGVANAACCLFLVFIVLHKHAGFTGVWHSWK